jgi:GTP-binding protein
VRVLDARYLASGTAVEQLPGPALPEVAFAGRSNVGKSSLLNTLVSRRGLARTSKTPGHTQKINLFEVRLEPTTVILADLPGYGYASRSKEERKSWGPMIEGYLLTRPSLRALVLLVDARRGIESEERELIEFWDQTKKPLIIVSTKVDKLPKSQLKSALAKMGSLGFSAHTGFGRDELWRRILQALAVAN